MFPLSSLVPPHSPVFMRNFVAGSRENSPSPTSSSDTSPNSGIGRVKGQLKGFKSTFGDDDDVMSVERREISNRVPQIRGTIPKISDIGAPKREICGTIPRYYESKRFPPVVTGYESFKFHASTFGPPAPIDGHMTVGSQNSNLEPSRLGDETLLNCDKKKARHEEVTGSYGKLHQDPSDSFQSNPTADLRNGLSNDLLNCHDSNLWNDQISNKQVQSCASHADALLQNMDACHEPGVSLTSGLSDHSSSSKLSCSQEVKTFSGASPSCAKVGTLIDFGNAKEWSSVLEAKLVEKSEQSFFNDLMDFDKDFGTVSVLVEGEAAEAVEANKRPLGYMHQSSSCSTDWSMSDSDFFSVQGGDSEEDMADVVKKSSELVSSNSSSASKKISTRQESHERREVVKQSSVTSSMVKQESFQSSSSSSQQMSSSSTSGSVVVSSSSIQLKQKQAMSAEMSSQMTKAAGGQTQITTTSSKQQAQTLMTNVNGQQQQQVSSSSSTQKSVQQLGSSQQQMITQQNQSANQLANNYIEEENENDEDLKVTLSVTNPELGPETDADLYFSNIVKKDGMIINETNDYSLNNNNVTVVQSLVDLDPINSVDEEDDCDDDHEIRAGAQIQQEKIIPKIDVHHPDLISDLEPPNLVPCLNIPDHSSTSSHDVCSSSSAKSSEGDSMGTMDIEELDKSSRPGSHIEEHRDAASSQGDVHDQEHEDEFDDEDEDAFDGDLSDARKKKKKVKKTESISVIELLDEKMRNLANKYKVATADNFTNGLPVCELRACEKRVFENVSVANLRRSFCDLTAQEQPEEEFTYHLVERPKSSFSKFEGAGGNNRSNNAEEQDERANGSNKNSGTRTCKGCGEKVFVMEMIKAEKASWHKNCFRCSECKKALSVDTYESNAGLLYCKPHFKELFQPKAVFESPEEAIAKRMKKRPELIIRENQPVELPPDVVRATIQPATADLEDLSVDVKSKFELFEHFKETEHKDKQKEPIIVKRSTSVLAKLAKYEGGMEGVGVGIPDSELNGGAPEVVSEDDDESDIPITSTRVPAEEYNYKLDDVKNKWESGMNSKKEEIHKHRQEEMQKFRTRLCLGKNSQLKEMYEKAVESSEQEVKKTTDLEELDLKEKRSIKEMFEKGIVRPIDDEETEETRTTAIDMDREVFEHGVAKTSRNMFQTLDRQASTTGGQTSPLPGAPKKIALRSPSGIIGVNDQNRVVEGEIVRSSDIINDEVRAEDVGNKFRYFETYTQQQEAAKQKKVFRITPPREGQVKMDSPEREVYRDPNVVRSTDTEEVVVGKTASKMLSVFKRLEESNGTDDVDSKTSRRPLKQFTPPRETRLEPKDSSAEEESEYESEEEQYENGQGAVHHEEDQFLKEVGSLARAKHLRAKFEKWETEENSRNERENGYAYHQESELIGEGTIESTKSIRARFEQPQQFEQPKVQKREVQVKRFVELQNSNGLNMEECAICNKRVYVMEKTEALGKIFHKNCFRCSQCKCVLRMGNFTQNQGTLYCTPHFKQLFKIKGNYDEGFGHETGKQIWMKKQLAKQAAEGGETKEN